jgi:hypothetical protein
MDFYIWIGIIFCISQSAIFSGLNLAVFSISRLRLEVDAANGNPEAYWHRPIIVTDTRVRLGEVIGRLKVKPQSPEDDVIDHDLILVWGIQKRIITGADLLGRLLRGIAMREEKSR